MSSDAELTRLERKIDKGFDKTSESVADLRQVIIKQGLQISEINGEVKISREARMRMIDDIGQNKVGVVEAKKIGSKAIEKVGQMDRKYLATLVVAAGGLLAFAADIIFDLLRGR